MTTAMSVCVQTQPGLEICLVGTPTRPAVRHRVALRFADILSADCPTPLPLPSQPPGLAAAPPDAPNPEALARQQCSALPHSREGAKCLKVWLQCGTINQRCRNRGRSSADRSHSHFQNLSVEAAPTSSPGSLRQTSAVSGHSAARCFPTRKLARQASPCAPFAGCCVVARTVGLFAIRTAMARWKRQTRLAQDDRRAAAEQTLAAGTLGWAFGFFIPKHRMATRTPFGEAAVSLAATDCVSFVAPRMGHLTAACDRNRLEGSALLASACCPNRVEGRAPSRPPEPGTRPRQSVALHVPSDMHEPRANCTTPETNPAQFFRTYRPPGMAALPSGAKPLLGIRLRAQ